MTAWPPSSASPAPWAGSALADDSEQWQADLLRHWPKADCDAGDGGGVASLRPEVRKAWLAQNPLPSNVRYYSLVTLPDPERISRIVRSSYKKLGQIDWRNDSQVIYFDQIVPGSTLLGFLNADHWAVAVPLDRSHTNHRRLRSPTRTTTRAKRCWRPCCVSSKRTWSIPRRDDSRRRGG